MNARFGQTVHFGSLYGETEYNTTAHMISGGLSFKMSPKLKFHVNGNYTMSEAAFDQFNMPETENRDLAEEYIHHSDYDYSNLHTYSDLEYGFMNLNFDAEFKIKDNLSWTVGMNYYDLDDKTGFVFGDESGSYYVVKTGFQFGALGW